MNTDKVDVDRWLDFNLGLSSAGQMLPRIEDSELQPLLNGQDDPMLPAMSASAAMDSDWNSLLVLPKQTCNTGNSQGGNGTTNITAFPESLKFEQPTVNINLQPQQDSLPSSQRLDRIESSLDRLQQTVSRLDLSLSAMQNDGLRMKTEITQVSEALDKLKKGLDKFCTHFAFEAAARTQMD